MSADLFVDDREGIDYTFSDKYHTYASWLWDLYDHTVLDEEGALALSRWIYEIARIRRTFEDDLQLQVATRQRPEIDYSVYVTNINHTVCMDKNDNLVEMRYYDEDGRIAWVENGNGDVIWGERPERNEAPYGISLDWDEEYDPGEGVLLEDEAEILDMEPLSEEDSLSEMDLPKDEADVVDLELLFEEDDEGENEDA